MIKHKNWGHIQYSPYFYTWYSYYNYYNNSFTKLSIPIQYKCTSRNQT